MRWLTAFLVVLLAACAAHADTGLDFPGNRGGGVSSIRFKFSAPHSNGLPAWGPSGVGVTVIWHARTAEEPLPAPCDNGTDRPFYTSFFWGNDGSWQPQHAVWGFHPYPRDGFFCDDGGKLYWSIANGSDIYDTTDDLITVWDTWRWQVSRVWGASGNDKEFEYVWDWLTGYNGSTISSVYEITDTISSWGDSNPTTPVLVWGDAPWNPTDEVYYGVIRGIMIFATQLSDADVETVVQNAEAGGSTPWTACGANCTNSVWYANINPTPTDIADDSGAGHNPSWENANRPALWEGSLLPSVSLRGGSISGGSVK